MPRLRATLATAVCALAIGGCGAVPQRDDFATVDATPCLLLTHRSGFADFRCHQPDRVLRFHRDPGTRDAYSGEGLQLLQFVLAEGLGIDLGETSMRWAREYGGLDVRGP